MRFGLSCDVPQHDVTQSLRGPGFPGDGIAGREADRVVKHSDFQAVCVSGRGLSHHLLTLMVND